VTRPPREAGKGEAWSPRPKIRKERSRPLPCPERTERAGRRGGRYRRGRRGDHPDWTPGDVRVRYYYPVSVSPRKRGKTAARGERTSIQKKGTTPKTANCQQGQQDLSEEKNHQREGRKSIYRGNGAWLPGKPSEWRRGGQGRLAHAGSFLKQRLKLESYSRQRGFTGGRKSILNAKKMPSPGLNKRGMVGGRERVLSGTEGSIDEQGSSWRYRTRVTIKYLFYKENSSDKEIQSPLVGTGKPEEGFHLKPSRHRVGGRKNGPWYYGWEKTCSCTKRGGFGRKGNLGLKT